METFKVTRKGRKAQKAKPIEQLSFSEKIEVMGKMLANLCYEEQKIVGGSSMSFVVSDIFDVRENVSKGTVKIIWEK